MSVDIVAELKKHGGYYECIKDKDGKRLTPLVGYAGKGLDRKHKVGDVYCNCAVLENQDPRFYLRHLIPGIDGPQSSHASLLTPEIEDFIRNKVDSIAGMPQGGLVFGAILAAVFGKKYVPPEKLVTRAKTPDLREESELVWGRYAPAPGERVLIVEDAINNISTGRNAAGLIRDAKAEPVGLLGLLNRSDPSVNAFGYRYCDSSYEIPVMAVQVNSFPQYEQYDPAVKEDLAAGNLVLKPKQEWERLMNALDAAQEKLGAK